MDNPTPAPEPATVNLEMKALSALGASKGGKARKNVLTPEERRDIARKAVQVRWAKAGKPPKASPAEPPQPPPIGKTKTQKSDDSYPFSMFRGKLQLGPLEIECHVLNDGRRVFTQTEMVRVLTAGKGRANLDVHIQGNPLITKNLIEENIIEFKVPGNPTLAKGREATVLIEICSRYLDARDEKLLRTGGQKRYAVQSDIIIRACAKVGIIALIDEATGYQKVRAANALQLKLQAFIAEDLQEWARMFPQEFWFELARLEGITYSPRSRPLRWGKYIMAFVYDAIDRDVGKKLREKNPKPQKGRNHHQWLKEFGKDKLTNQITSVVTIMKLCNNMDDFRSKFDRVFKKGPVQTNFDDINWDAS